MSKIITLFFLISQITLAQIDVVYNNLVWSDEFNTNGDVNAINWHHQTQIPVGGSWFNNEVQHYTNESTNSFVENGLLKIVAKKENYTSQGYTKEYTSARLNSKFSFLYGSVDIRAKIPKDLGTWPALWMLGKNVNEDGGFFDASFGTTNWPACGEIDIMEHGITNSQPDNYVQSALHTPSSFGNTVNIGGVIIGNNIADNFHIYSVNWSPYQITFLVDGVAFYTYNPAIKDASTWPFIAEQYLLLNIAMGGIAGTIPSNFTQTSMEIDYVRVYQNTAADTQAPTNFTASIGTVTSSTIEILVNGQDNSGSLSYNIAYGSQNVQTASPSGIQKSIVIPNLNPNTPYTFNVTASDVSGNNAVNNPIILNATTTGIIGCSGTSTLAQQGNFTTGYQYNYETLGNNVKITYRILDENLVGLVAFLWRQSPFQETQMTQIDSNTFTHTVTNLTAGQNITYGVKFAYAGGASVTNYYTYQVGNNCNLNLNNQEINFEFNFENPAKEILKIASTVILDRIEIYDFMGKLVLKSKNNEQPLLINHLLKGVYVIKAFSGENKQIKKLIIE